MSEHIVSPKLYLLIFGLRPSGNHLKTRSEPELTPHLEQFEVGQIIVGLMAEKIAQPLGNDLIG